VKKRPQKDQSIVFIIDSSAILSGKPLPVDQQCCWTVDEIASEFSEGGSSWRMFQYLKEKGLSIRKPSNEAKKMVNETINKLGETLRLSNADQSVLALAVDVSFDKEKKPVILTDDYSIQNIASVLDIEIQSISQKGITKTFKWIRRCRGCGRILLPDESVCKICGSTAKFVVDKTIKKKKG
jgi:UPF0271 protein